MYLRAHSDLIYAIKSRAQHAMRNAESFFFLKKDNVCARRRSNQQKRRKKRKTIHRDCIRRYVARVTRIFSHQEDGQDRIPPNVERFRRKYVYYVNSRDKNQVNAIQGIEIKILTV